MPFLVTHGNWIYGVQIDNEKNMLHVPNAKHLLSTHRTSQQNIQEYIDIILIIYQIYTRCHHLHIHSRICSDQYHWIQYHYNERRLWFRYGTWQDPYWSHQNYNGNFTVQEEAVSDHQTRSVDLTIYHTIYNLSFGTDNSFRIVSATPRHGFELKLQLSWNWVSLSLSFMIIMPNSRQFLPYDLKIMLRNTNFGVFV